MQTDELLTRTLKLRATEISETGEFTGYASTWDEDAYGDRLLPGSFKKTLADSGRRPLLWSHRPDEPVGVIDLAEDQRGLRARGKLILEVERAREAYALLKAGALKGLSIGFVPRKFEYVDGGEKRLIREAELYEVSLTPFPANRYATVSDVRAHQPAPAAEKSKENEMEVKELVAPIEQKVNDIAAKFIEMQKQVDIIDGKTQSWATSPRGGGQDFASELVRKFAEHRDGFDRFGRVKFEVRTVTSAGITTPQPSAEIGLAGAPSYGAVRRLFRVVSADGASVFAVREQSAAGWVASPQVETNEKNQASVTLTAETLPIRTIAVWIDASKQALEDVPGLENFIRSRLLWALEAEIEEQLLLGDGAGENLSGLVTSATSFDTTILGSSWNLADVIGGAAVQVRLAGFEPNFVIMHPRDVFRLRHAKDTTGQYVSLPPLPRIIESAALGEGEFIAGDSSQAVIRAREAAAIEIATEHSDYFVKNKVAIRAEERLALQVISPAAFVKGTLTTSPA